jgi:hypothetical protein
MKRKENIMCKQLRIEHWEEHGVLPKEGEIDGC